jgi:hypothetical protein
MIVHEERFIRTFIVPNKRDRYLTLFGTKKGRGELTTRLNHNHDLGCQFLQRIPSPKHTVDSIFALLKKRGAPTGCYVISDGHLDGQQMELKDALMETVGQGIGTVISCIHGELGYFEAEDPGERYLLCRV